jgi:hypothetical protein
VSASLFSIIVLAFAAGFATPYVLHWIDWQRGKWKHDERRRHGLED